MVTSGHRTFCAKVEIIAALLESLRPLLCDLRTVVLLNFKEVNRRTNGLNFLVLEVSITLYLLLFITTQAIVVLKYYNFIIYNTS